MTKIFLIILLSLYSKIIFTSCQKSEQKNITQTENISHFDLEKDIIYISNYRELKILASTVNYGNDFFGKTIVILNDIECDIDDIFEGIGYYNAKHDNAPFRGQIDGNSKTIKNINIKKPNESNVGFIKYMAQGSVVKNLTITGLIEGHENAGTFAGFTEGNVLISNSTNHAHVKAVKYGGGIVGMSLELNGKSSEIIGTENNGRIKSQTYAGGIIGYGEKTFLSDARNYGVIHAENRIENEGIIGLSKDCIISGILNEGVIEDINNISLHKDETNK